MRTHIDTGASIAEMESENRPRPTLDLDTDNFQSQETNSTASEHQVSRGMAHSVRAIYSTRLALFIHGITSAKRTREVRPAVLRRESSAQLIMYSHSIPSELQVSRAAAVSRGPAPSAL